MFGTSEVKKPSEPTGLIISKGQMDWYMWLILLTKLDLQKALKNCNPYLRKQNWQEFHCLYLPINKTWT